MAFSLRPKKPGVPRSCFLCFGIFFRASGFGLASSAFLVWFLLLTLRCVMRLLSVVLFSLFSVLCFWLILLCLQRGNDRKAIRN